MHMRKDMNYVVDKLMRDNDMGEDRMNKRIFITIFFNWFTSIEPHLTSSWPLLLSEDTEGKAFVLLIQHMHLCVFRGSLHAPRIICNSVYSSAVVCSVPPVKHAIVVYHDS